MSKASTARIFSREFKLPAVRRMLAGENVSALARELAVLRKDLYVWRDRFRAGGPEALRSRGRPRKGRPTAPAAPSRPPDRPPDAAAAELAAACRRITDLEAKIGRQQLELDFFRQALRQVEEAGRPEGGAGATPSTRSSKR
jgi:transposase-like protein